MAEGLPSKLTRDQRPLKLIHVPPKDLPCLFRISSASER